MIWWTGSDHSSSKVMRRTEGCVCLYASTDTTRVGSSSRLLLVESTTAPPAQEREEGGEEEEGEEE